MYAAVCNWKSIRWSFLKCERLIFWSLRLNLISTPNPKGTLLHIYLIWIHTHTHTARHFETKPSCSHERMPVFNVAQAQNVSTSDFQIHCCHKHMKIRISHQLWIKTPKQHLLLAWPESRRRQGWPEIEQEKKPCVWLGRRGTANGRRTQRQWEEWWDDHSSSFVSASQDIPQQGPGSGVTAKGT